MSAFENIENICEQAILCEKDCACLENPSSMCPVVESLRDIVLFIEPKDKKFCRYKIDLNCSAQLRCPRFSFGIG